MSDNTYKAKLHVATGQFSFMEVEIEDTMPQIMAKNAYLLNQFRNVQK